MAAVENQSALHETSAHYRGGMGNNIHYSGVTKTSSAEKVSTGGPQDVTPVDPRTTLANSGKAVFLIGGSATLLSVIVLSMLFIFLDRPRVVPIQDQSDFCCDTEARQVMATVNTSLDPCNDFYQHVCAKAADIESIYVSPMFKVAVYWKEVEALGIGGSPAGIFISALRPTLPTGLFIAETDVANFTAAILDTVTHVPKPLASASSIVTFFAELSLVYKVPTVLSFGVPAKESGSPATTLVLDRRTDCFTEVDPGTWIKAGLEVFNAKFKSTVELDDLLAFAEKISSSAVKQPREKREIRHVYNVPFDGVSQRQWSKVLKEFVFPLYPDVKYLSLSPDHDLSELLDVLSKAVNQPVSLAYAVVCAAEKAAVDVTDAIFDYHSQLSLCLSDKLHICALEDVVKAEAVSNHVDDALLREMMNRVRDAVVRDALSSHIFRDQDRELVSTELWRMRLMLPKESSGAEKVPAPDAQAASNLAYSVLQARFYVFSIERAKIRRGIPSRDFLSDVRVKRQRDVLYVPTNLYVQLRFISRERDFMVLPMAGVSMAAEMWSFLLENKAWSNDTLVNIASFYACFRNSYFGIREDDGTATNMAHTALGLVSAQNSADRLEWDSPHKIDSVYLTLQQLFYYLFVYNQCSLVPMEKPGPTLNVALRNDAEFGRSFRCEARSSMSQRVTCMT
ncbi:hypothetical protein V5799_006712 [Amblyomma americanum]|uniref:Uncharacterized protein n=1 Tax=Amblyomma americanum TaxID=6943 RepID=A0AAQ4DVL7_AMBAM